MQSLAASLWCLQYFFAAIVEPLDCPLRFIVGADGSKSTAASVTAGGDGADDSESTTAAVAVGD